jgi:hypothetical protein
MKKTFDVLSFAADRVRASCGSLGASAKVVAVAALSSVSSAALATDPTTLADLTTGISFATAATAVLVIAASIIGFKVLKQGAMIVMGMITKAR